MSMQPTKEQRIEELESRLRAAEAGYVNEHNIAIDYLAKFTIAKSELRAAEAERDALRDSAYSDQREIDGLRARVAALESGLRAIEQWDMLTLTEDGHGAATADAPHFRALIAALLDGTPE